ncbi:hypothetical protein EMPS_00311 [Entomortierella parvispora]|uniref:Galactose oxidase n=1 Tax=Entomortierella parvispora TaxID=205924 RepID=A0A9P3H0G3_9FUNG|nr:hypothetical protein EMPS_00311 [Entomortierella parvispora]
MARDPPAAMTRSPVQMLWRAGFTLFFSTALSILFSGLQHALLTAYAQPLTVPLSVSGAATARTATKMYVQGGNHSGTLIAQLYSLDLAVPWSTNMPAWTQLTNTGPAQELFPAAFSADGMTMITFHSGTTFAYRYSVQSDRWSRSSISVANPGFQGVGAVLDTYDSQVYLTGGYTNRNEVSVYNFAFDTIMDAVTLPPPSVALAARAYYGCVWSKTRKSILYFGGYNETLSPIVNSNVVTEYVPLTGQWQTLATTGTPPPMRSDHCMVISDDGTQIVIYGGTLSSTFAYTNDIYILDLTTMTWRQGVSGLTRAYASCVMAGSQLIVWGGVDQNKNTVPATILIYDAQMNSWINNYIPPQSYVDIAKNSTNTTDPGSGDTNGPLKPPHAASTHAGAIAGGVVGGLAVICAAVLFFVFWKRRSAFGGMARGQGQDNRDRKYPADLSQNDEELQNLRLQVQTQEEELELRRRLYQLQQEQQQQQQQMQLQMQSQHPYSAQPVTTAPPITSGGGGTIAYGYDPFRNGSGSTLHPHPYAQLQHSYPHFDAVKSPAGPIGTTAPASPLLPIYSAQPLSYHRDYQQGGTSSQAHSLASSSSSAVPSQTNAPTIYAAHPYRPPDGSPTPSYALVSATNTIGSMSTSSQPPSRVNSSRHQQQRPSNTQQQGSDLTATTDDAGGSSAQHGIGTGGEVQRVEPRSRSPKNPQLGARERRQ